MDPKNESTPTSAGLNKIADLLARRDHSERELLQKLRRKFTLEEARVALERARDLGWLPQPQKLSERWSERLNEQNKSHYYICKRLQAKGLPTPQKIVELEVQKAWQVVHSKFANCDKIAYEDRAKVMRLLSYRGFDSETIKKVIYESR